jgi:hypothetical protein
VESGGIILGYSSLVITRDPSEHFGISEHPKTIKHNKEINAFFKIFLLRCLTAGS